MNKTLLVAFVVLAMASSALSNGATGYGVAIDHLPLHGYGVGRSVRYDHRTYPFYGGLGGVGLGYGGAGLGLGYGGVGLGYRAVGLRGLGLGGGLGLGLGGVLL